jgi:hypothetical protein
MDGIIKHGAMNKSTMVGGFCMPATGRRECNERREKIKSKDIIVHGILDLKKAAAARILPDR